MKTIKENIELARNGNEEAKRELVDYYKDWFKRYVNSIYDGKYDDYSEGFLIFLIDDYLNKNLLTKLKDFLSSNAKTIEKRYSFGFFRLKDLIYDGSKKSIDYLINYYKNNYILYVKSVTEILNDKEIENLVHNYLFKYISEKIKKFDSYKSVISAISGRLARFKNTYDSEEKILRLYSEYVELNEKIVKYFCKKYEFILNKYDKTKYYNELKNSFEGCIKNSLNNNFGYNFEKLLLKELEKQKEKIFSNLKEKELNKEDISLENYLYIKDKIFNMYQSFFKKEELNKIINEKFDEYYEAYLKGESKSTLPKYLQVRIEDYLNKCVKKKDLINQNEDKIQELINNNYDVYYNNLKFCSGYYPYKKTVLKKYKESCEKYIILKHSNNEKAYLKHRLRKDISLENKNNTYEILNLVLEEYKQKHIFDSDIEEEIYYGLLRFYIDYEVYKDVYFDEYLAKSIIYFDTEKYREEKERINEYRRNNKFC